MRGVRGRGAAPTTRVRGCGAAIALVTSGGLLGCYQVAPAEGGGQIARATAAEARARPRVGDDVVVPPGYRIELVARGLTSPTGVAFGDDGAIYLAEAGDSTGEVETAPRILRLDRRAGGGRIRVVARGTHAPWSGLAFADGALFVAQGGAREGGRVVRIDPDDGDEEILVDGLPSTGDHHTTGPIVVDGWVYFGQGTRTNSGVVGTDNHRLGWLARRPTDHDVPCGDVALRGVNFVTDDPLTEDADDQVATGAFLPFGTASTPGQVIEGALPCNGAIMRVRTDGDGLELVAWGLRNPYGLAATPDGTIYATEDGYDERGSRPIYGSADALWRIEPGTWYGFPDFADGRRITEAFHGEGDGAPRGPLLARHPQTPPRPLARFGVHASASGLDVSRSARFGHQGDAFVALFGDVAPEGGEVIGPVGFEVARVDLATGAIEDFARNGSDENGPASRLGLRRGLERPIAARFDPSGEALYVVDFGVLRMGARGVEPQAGTGTLWRIAREEVGRARR